MRARTKIGFAATGVGLAVFLYLLLTGPRMIVQPHILTYEARMALPPAGSVAVDRPVLLPTAEEAQTMTNPLAATEQSLARGKTYYGYYCAFCHGETGAGDGPVGESYVPAPSDLRGAAIQAYSDGQMLRAMLLGVGNAPVLEKVVPSDQRWYIVLYVRSLADVTDTGMGPTGGKENAAEQPATSR